MSEIMAVTNADGTIGLLDAQSRRIEGAPLMTPLEGAYLAIALLATAAATSGANHPSPGSIIGDAHLPIAHWKVGTSYSDGAPVLVLMVPPGVELTFRMTPGGAKAMGADVVALGEKLSPPAPSGRVVH